MKSMTLKTLRKLTALALSAAMLATSCDLSMVAEAAGRDRRTKASPDIDTEMVYKEPEGLVRTEVPGLRTEDSTTWRLSDGLMQTEFYASAVRFQDGEGRLTDYDTSLVEVSGDVTPGGLGLDGYAYENAAGDIKHYLPEHLTADTPVLLEKDGFSVSVLPVSPAEADETAGTAMVLSEAPAPGRSPNLQAYDNGEKETSYFTAAQAGPVSCLEEEVTDLYGETEEKASAAVYEEAGRKQAYSYKPFDTGLKEDIILYEEPEENSWQFVLELGGLKAAMIPGTQAVAFYTEDEKGRMTVEGGIQEPFMNDATGENYSDDIVCTLEEDAGSEGRYLLTMTADRGYLSSEDTAYPVTIDPSYTWCGDGEFTDVYVSGAYPDYNFYAPGTTGMYTGKTASHGVRRTYLSFSGITSRILDKSVAEAVLSVYEISGGTAGEEVEARCVKAAWTPSALTWNSRPGIYATVMDSFTYTGTHQARHDLDMTIYAKKVARSLIDDHGLVLKSASEVLGNSTRFYGSRHSTAAYRPSITVTYLDRPSAATEVTVTGTYHRAGERLNVCWDGIASPALSSLRYAIVPVDGDGSYDASAAEFIPQTISTGKNFSADTAGLADGDYRLLLKGRDLYGGESDVRASGVFTVDSTAPVLSQAGFGSSFAAQASSADPVPEIGWSLSDDNPDRVVYYIGSGAEEHVLGTGTSGSARIGQGLLTASGTYAIRVQAVGL